MAAGDTTSISISASTSNAAVETAIEALSIVSGDIVLAVNHGGESRIIKIKTA